MATKEITFKTMVKFIIFYLCFSLILGVVIGFVGFKISDNSIKNYDASFIHGCTSAKLSEDECMIKLQKYLQYLSSSDNHSYQDNNTL